MEEEEGRRGFSPQPHLLSSTHSHSRSLCKYVTTRSWRRLIPLLVEQAAAGISLDGMGGRDISRQSTRAAPCHNIEAGVQMPLILSDEAVMNQ